MKEKPVYKWKALMKNSKSLYHDFEWETGKWYTTKGELELCCNGFHCSDLITDALKYVNGEYIAKVEVKGNKLISSDKSCHEYMRVVKKWKWEKEGSIKLAIYAASLVLHIYEKEHPNDKIPRKAIQAAKACLKNPCNSTSNAATYAAYATAYADNAAAYADNATAYAAYAAAYAAKAAAYAAKATAYAAYATANAAKATAYAAKATAYAAYAAAYAANTANCKTIKTKCQKWIIRHLAKKEKSQ